MATYTPLITSLRYYIGDVSLPNSYIDSDLNQYVILGAQAVVTELSVAPVTYTVSVQNLTINPDPSSDETRGGLSNLFVLKAAVILALSEARKDVAKYGIRIKEDLTSYDGTAALKGRQDSLKFYIDNYEKTKWDWERGNKYAGRSILGPYESATLGSNGSSVMYNSAQDAFRR